MKRWATIPIVLLFCALLWPMSAAGQGVTTSSISGKVTDTNGEPLPGANVIAVHQPSGTRYGTSTNQNGRYNLANLRVGGPYQVTASFVGYQSKRETGIELGLGANRTIGFDLKEKTAELDEVEIVAQRGALAEEQQGIGTRISAADIDAAPTQGRKLADITRLTPQSYVANSDDDGPAVSFAGQNTDFNSIFIDGAVSNDVFGLSAQGTDGGQTGATPISLSAIEEFNVDISPYDVTQSGFTGAAINAVTKSGSNQFEGQVEYYRRSENFAETTSEFSNNRFVGSIGGPIIKDKLFFFVNADVLRSEEPQPFGVSDEELLSATNGRLSVTGTDDDNEVESLEEIRNFVERNTGYEPGGFRTRNTTLDSEKILAKLDYNLSENHRLTARYFYTGSENTDQFQSTADGINYGNSAEFFPNDTHNAMLQWNGSFGNQVSNKLIASYKSVKDDRGVVGEPFPNLNILEGDFSGDYLVSLGSEPFSGINLVDQDVFTLTNTTDIFLGDHTLTVGTHNEYYEVQNKFALFSVGNYEFDTVRNFEETVCDYAERTDGFSPDGPVCSKFSDPEPQTDFFLRQYSLADNDFSEPGFTSVFGDDTALGPTIAGLQLGFYVQDEWQVSDRLRVTFGMRADIPKLLDDPAQAEDANTTTLSDQGDRATGAVYDLNGAQAGDTPDWQVFWQPRFGFNYDLTDEGTTQVRGGTGIFTSRLPFVWPYSMYTNNGVSTDFLLGGGQELRRPENGIDRTDTAADFYISGAQPGVSQEDLIPTGNLHVFSEDFSYPRVWRTSLGIDTNLPGGFIATLEGQYTNQLKDIIVKNVNLRRANEAMDGPDKRPIHVYSVDTGEETPDEVGLPLNPNDGVLEAGNAGLIDDRYGDVLVAQNTSRGHSYNITARLQKETTQVWDGATLRGNASYTYGDAYSLQSYGGDTIGSLWEDNEHVNGTNNLEIGRSEFSLGHRIQLSASLRQEFADNYALNVSAFYTGISGRPYSYTIAGGREAMIGTDGGAPLMYIPQSASQLEFDPITDGEGNVLRTVAEQQADVDRILESVDYLDENRGSYADRNADRTPFEHVVDLKFSLEVFGDVLQRSQRLNVNFNIFNFTALAGNVLEDAGFGVGEDWGKRYLSRTDVSVLEFQRFKDPNGNDGNPNNDFVPVYQSALGSGSDIERKKDDFFDEKTAGSTYSSRYQVQFGVTYTF
jgi:outer membrane receptor for ferrienterochelin and colicin